MVEDFVLCLKNQENITADYSVMQAAFLDDLYDTLNGVRTQFNLTFQNYDMEDYVKSFLLNENNKTFITSGFIDENQFYHTLVDTFENYFNIFLGISVLDKIEAVCPDMNIIDKFTSIYYKAYLNIILSQRFIENILYLSFSNLSNKQIQQIEDIIGKSLYREQTKSLSKKYKLKQNNYVMDLSANIKDKETLVNIVKNTSIFDKSLFNMIYHSEDLPKNYLFEIFIRNSSKYDIESMFKNLLKNDDSLTSLINRIEVFAINSNFNYRSFNEDNEE